MTSRMMMIRHIQVLLITQGSLSFDYIIIIFIIIISLLLLRLGLTLWSIFYSKFISIWNGWMKKKNEIKKDQFHACSYYIPMNECDDGHTQHKFDTQVTIRMKLYQHHQTYIPAAYLDIYGQISPPPSHPPPICNDYTHMIFWIRTFMMAANYIGVSTKNKQTYSFSCNVLYVSMFSLY